MQRIRSGLTHSTLQIHKDVADLFNFVSSNEAKTEYFPGPNATYVPCETAFTSDNVPYASSLNLGGYHFTGKVFFCVRAPDTTPSSPIGSRHRPHTIKLVGDYYQFSRFVTWTFTKLNESFDKLVETSKRTIMLYSNLTTLRCWVENDIHCCVN